MSAPTLSTVPTTGHCEEHVRDGEGFLVGCKCGWVCSGHADDLYLAIEMWRLHVAAILSRHSLA